MLFPVSLLAQIDCASDERYGALDFLVGQWQVATTDGQVLGESHITKRQGGCVIAEAWTGSSGDTAETVTYLDPTTGTWHQLGLSSAGGVLQVEATFADQAAKRAGQLTLEGSLIGPTGKSMVRGTLERDADGVAESLESSSDGGATFSPVLLVRYLPLDRTSSKADARTRPPKQQQAVQEEAPQQREAREEAATSSPRVRTLSARNSEARDIIDVELPMILEVALGAIEEVPEGYSWSSDDTSSYRCEGVTVTQVQVSHRTRKGRLRLEVAILLRGERRSDRFGLEVALLDGERVVRSDGDRIQVGYGIPSQMDNGAVTRKFSWEISEEEFDQLFRDGPNRPDLQVTLSAP